MTNEFPFLENVRQALKIPQGAERTKSMFPDLFAKNDKTTHLSNIRTRSYVEKELLIEQLAGNCIGLNINLHVVDSLKGAEDITVDLIRTKRPEFSHNRHIIQHNHPDIAAMKLWKRFNRESVTVHTTYSGDEQIVEKTIASYIGITAPDIGVAESATLIQLTKPGSPRSTSLVPSIQIALIKSENLVAHLEEAYALLEEIGPKDSFVFISGPSKTADIETHMVHGAHGPKEVHIILIKEAEPEIVAEPEINANPEAIEDSMEEAAEDVEDVEENITQSKDAEDIAPDTVSEKD